MIDWLDEFYGSPETKQLLEESYAPLFSALGAAVGTAAGAEVGIASPAVGGFVEAMLSSYVDRYLDSSRVQLTELLDSPDPGQEIAQRLDEWVEKRPGKVAAEETVRTANAVTETVYRDAGVTRKKWSARGKSCPYCRKMNGKVVGIDRPFHREGDSIEVPDSEIAAKATMNFTHEIGHPPQHGGCDCVIEAESDFNEANVGKWSQYSSAQLEATLNDPRMTPGRTRSELEEALRRRKGVPRATVDWAKNIWGSSRNSEFFKSLTPAQLDALSRYSGKDYVEFNGYFRKIAKGQSPRLTKALSARLDALQEAIDRQGLPSAVKVQRATTISAFDRFHPKTFIGKTVTEPGFMSTSTKSLESFAGYDHAVKMTITAPAGTRAIYMEPITQAKKEQEILFGRGTTLRIDAVRERHTGGTALAPKRTIYEVDATIVPTP